MCQLPHVAPIGIHDIDIELFVAAGEERDLPSIC
jgi:hypothetical protein